VFAVFKKFGPGHRIVATFPIRILKNGNSSTTTGRMGNPEAEASYTNAARSTSKTHISLMTVEIVYTVQKNILEKFQQLIN
jgi:hypothetical protein